MASWTLGKIFSVDEEKEATQDLSGSGSDDDGDESEDDEDALERQAAFNKNKHNSPSGAAPVAGSNRSVRRYDEYGDFLSRSERAHSERFGDDSALSTRGDVRTRERNDKCSGKPSVRWQPEEVASVHEIPKFTDEEKEVLFMTQSNWQSIDTDINITTKRWNNHMEGHIAFDEDNNTIRGIEDMIFNLNKSRPIMKHRKAILEEVVRQKTENEYPNWTKLSAVSLTSSAPQRKMAVELGREDEQEKNRVWSNKVTEPLRKSNPSKEKKSKRKNSFFGLFKKK